MKLPKNKFIKHVSSRWLTVSNAASRLIEQWPAVIKYFLSFIPKKCAEIASTSTYRTIKGFLSNPTIKAEVLFTISSADLLTAFTGTFQRCEPLIHILYTEIKLLLTKIMFRICKQDAVKLLEAGDTSVTQLFDPKNLLDLSDIYKVTNS